MSWEIGEYINKNKHYLELPKTIHLPEDIEISGELVRRLVDEHKNRKYRYELLQKYYDGWARIYDRVPKKSYKPDNRLVTPYPSYIVDILLGMFLGKPVSYHYERFEDNETEEAWDDIQATLDYNDENMKNYNHAKTMGIKGVSYELIYANENNHIRIAKIEPDEILYVYDNQVEPQPLMALYIRANHNILTNKQENLVTVYDRNNIIEFVENEHGYVEISSTPHYFKDVPVTEIKNNNEGIGDFERVLPLIDAVNISQSDTANDFEEFTDALLILYGMLNANVEDVTQLLDDAILLLDEVSGSQGAEWLIKEINDVALENYKDRLDDYIHKFSKVPNMSDENFGGNQTGVSQKYKLLAMDQVIAEKRSQMTTALQRRLRLMLERKSVSKDIMDKLKYKDIAIVFKDNKPIDERENIEMVNNLKGIVSEKTALSRLYFMENVDKELEALEQERDAYADAFNYAVQEADTDEEEN